MYLFRGESAVFERETIRPAATLDQVLGFCPLAEGDRTVTLRTQHFVRARPRPQRCSWLRIARLFAKETLSPNGRTLTWRTSTPSPFDGSPQRRHAFHADRVADHGDDRERRTAKDHPLNPGGAAAARHEG